MADPRSIREHLEAIRSEVGEFAKGGWHSTDGDSLYFFNESADQYRDRVDDVLTLYRAEDDDRIVGVQIKGVSRLPDHEEAKVFVASGAGKAFSVALLLIAKLTEKRSEPGFLEGRERPYIDAVRAFSPSVPMAHQNGEAVYN